MTLSVIIVSHGHETMLKECLESLARPLESDDSEIIIVDNLNGQEGKDEIINIPSNARIIKNREPRGYAWNINKGAECANGRYLLILNPDTKYQYGDLGELMQFLDSTAAAGVVTCRMINEDGSDQQNYRIFPTLQFVLARGIGVGNISWKPGFYSKGMMEEIKVSVPTPVDWVTGAFMMMKSEVFRRVGGMDEMFPLYYEDVDLCYRCREAGYENYVYPDLCFKHLHLRTSAKRPFGLHWRWHVKSIVRYFWKHQYLFKAPLWDRNRAR